MGDDDYLPPADEPGHLDAIEARLAAAEQRVAEPMHVIHEMRQPDPLADPDQVMETLEGQVHDLQIGLGRQLRLDEKRILVNHVMDAVQAGEGVDVETALARADWRGELGEHGVGDMNDDAFRQQHMAGRLMDAERVQEAEQGRRDLTLPDDQQPFDYSTVDVENDQERQAAMTARLQGRPDSANELEI